MTTTAQPSAEVVQLDRALVKNWKAPISFGAIALVALVMFVVFAREGITTLTLSGRNDFIQLPSLSMQVVLTGIIVTVLLIGLAVVSLLRTMRGMKTPLWVTIPFGVLFVLGFLTWAGADKTIPIPGLIVSTVILSTPLIFGALGGVISERAGVVNVAIEGQLLAGAFCSALVATVTGSSIIGLFAAMAAGVLVSFVLAAFAIKYLVEQVIVGVVLNVLVQGLTTFFFSTIMTANPEALNAPERFSRIRIPLLADMPILGPVLFHQPIIVYLMYIAVAVVTYCLFRTTWGLRLRAAGEHPLAADTVGIRVNRLRFWNVSLAGAVAGLGGAYFTLGSNGAFSKEMTAGLGFIALAAVIFGQWHPVKATLAALLFGFASSLENTLSAIGSPVPSDFLKMLPYVVTILAVSGFIGQSRAPAASGKPYIKS
ncbi:ABC transporter permease [Humidisolicoccus flavus]|uniref:ABC transporter permease n=1 Tax=Humidisolicoccus flavus TaxID=3111414 RepID=UPI00324935A1